MPCPVLLALNWGKHGHYGAASSVNLPRVSGEGLQERRFVMLLLPQRTTEGHDESKPPPLRVSSTAQAMGNVGSTPPCGWCL